LDNRLKIHDELKTVRKPFKVIGWCFVFLYCIATSGYVCLFGVIRGADTTNAWLVSTTISLFQEFVIVVALKVLFLNVFLPGLVSEKIHHINDPSDVINSHSHQFKSAEANVFVPRNAAIRVAMRMPKLETSHMLLARTHMASDPKEQVVTMSIAAAQGAVEQRAGAALGDDAAANSRRASRAVNSFYDQREAFQNYRAGRLLTRSVILFTFFIHIPEEIQATILDTILPIMFGFFIILNYELSRIYNWSPVVFNFGLIFLFFVVAYLSSRARQNKITKDALKRIQRKKAAAKLASLANEKSTSRKGEEKDGGGDDIAAIEPSSSSSFYGSSSKKEGESRESSKALTGRAKEEEEEEEEKEEIEEISLSQPINTKRGDAILGVILGSEQANSPGKVRMYHPILPKNSEKNIGKIQPTF
jgi:hypothetical protein